MHERRADFDRFVADSSDTLLRTAYLIVWDLGEAEDLVQETLFEVARRWPLDLPEAEVAAAMKCSLGTVKSTASRGLARLEQAMRPAHDPRSIPT
jgi:DNA-directed RNA polymerase specialized sigma24 family protein